MLRQLARAKATLRPCILPTLVHRWSGFLTAAAMQALRPLSVTGLRTAPALFLRCSPAGSRHRNRRVKKTWSCRAPFHEGAPVAMTSMRRSSKRATATFRSRTRVLRRPFERASTTAQSTRPSAGCSVIAKRVERATTPTGALGQRQREAQTPQQQGTQAGKREREGERAAAERPGLGKQEGPGSSIKLRTGGSCSAMAAPVRLARAAPTAP